MDVARKLVAQCEILGDEICTILENGGNNGENQWQLERHLADHSLSPNDRKTSAIPSSYPIMTRHSVLTKTFIAICIYSICGALSGAPLLLATSGFLASGSDWVGYLLLFVTPACVASLLGGAVRAESINGASGVVRLMLITVAWGVASTGGVVAAVLPLVGGAIFARMFEDALHRAGTLLGSVLVSLGLIWLALPGSGDSIAPRNQLVVIGLDGASWSIVDEMRDAGRLPAFDRMVRTGTRGSMKTLVPVMSPPIWTSMATGVAPAEHGIKDFFGTSDQVNAKRIWEIADEAGLTSGVYGYLVTWPPEKDKGFLVPGWLARDERAFPSNLSFTKLVQRWLDGVDPVPSSEVPGMLLAAVRHGLTFESIRALAAIAHAGGGGADPRLAELARKRAILSIDTDTFCHQLRRHRPDLAVYYQHMIDVVGHHYFKYFRADQMPGLDPQEVALHGEAVPSFYEASDRQLERIQACAEAGATFMVVSDHGMKLDKRIGAGSGKIKTGELLESLGLADSFQPFHLGGDRIYLRPHSADVDLRAAVFRLASIVDARSGDTAFKVRLNGEGIIFVRSIRYQPDKKLRLPDGKIFPIDKLFGAAEKMSGTHSQRALLLLNGPNIIAGQELELAHIYDTAPTILALLGLPLGRDMKGRFLVEAVREDVRPGYELRWVTSHGQPGWQRDKSNVAPSKRALEQLRAIGYVEE